MTTQPFRNKKEEPFPNQKEASNAILSLALTPEKKAICLIAQPQVGKTGTIINAIDNILLHHEHNELLYHDEKRGNTRVLWFIGSSDKQLSAQSLKVIKQRPAVFQTLVGRSVYYPGLLGKASKQKNDIEEEINDGKQGLLTLVYDECHLAVGDGQVVPNFLKSHGIFPGVDSYKSSVLSIVVSATPSPQLNFLGVDENSFDFVYLKPGEGYCSFEKILQSGRMHDAFEVTDTDTSSFQRFKKEALDPFLSGNPGYFIVRVSDQNGFLAKKLMENQTVLNYDVKTYTSNAKNIGDLPGDLCNLPAKHKVCIIVDSYLQGKTFDTLEHVKGWFDRIHGTEAGTIQSVGRVCGYDDLKKNKKINVDFPVWCSLEHIRKAIQFYKDAENNKWELVCANLLSTTHVSNQERTRNHFQQEAFNSYSEAKEFLSKNGHKFHYHTRCSTNVDTNLAQAVLNRTSRQMHDGEDSFIIFLDSPNPQFQKDWDKLPQHFVGKWIACYDPKQVTEKIGVKNTSAYGGTSDKKSSPSSKSFLSKKQAFLKSLK